MMKCPNCNSENIYAVNNKYQAVRGRLGSERKTKHICLKCGFSFHDKINGVVV